MDLAAEIRFAVAEESQAAAREMQGMCIAARPEVVSQSAGMNWWDAEMRFLLPPTGVDLQYHIADIDAAVSALEKVQWKGKEDHAKK